MQGFVDDLRALGQQFHGFLTRTWTPNRVPPPKTARKVHGISLWFEKFLGTTIGFVTV